jgi:cytoskeletal protein CcmA (bactofilin family)
LPGMPQVDGDIEGDVQAAEVIVSEKGKVAGMVAGQHDTGVEGRQQIPRKTCEKSATLNCALRQQPVEETKTVLAMALR